MIPLAWLTRTIESAVHEWINTCWQTGNNRLPITCTVHQSVKTTGIEKQQALLSARQEFTNTQPCNQTSFESQQKARKVATVPEIKVITCSVVYSLPVCVYTVECVGIPRVVYRVWIKKVFHLKPNELRTIVAINFHNCYSESECGSDLVNWCRISQTGIEVVAYNFSVSIVFQKSLKRMEIQPLM